MGDGLISPNGATSGWPHGFAVRQSPAATVGHWHDVCVLDGGRFGVSMGVAADVGTVPGSRSTLLKTLQATGDPARALAGVDDAVATAVCIVIDGAASCLRYSGTGDAVVILADVDNDARVLEPARGTVLEAVLRPGTTVLAHTAGGSSAGLDFPEGGTTAHPTQVAEQVLTRLGPSAAVSVLVYRHPPEPLRISVPAEPANLALVRHHLRRWLALASVDARDSAETLLAVGEAASNSTEHAVLGARHTVELTVRASISQRRIQLEVSDDGRWRPPPECSGHRGHGIRLMKALVDTADLTSTDNGTTVAMLKELSQ